MPVHLGDRDVGIPVGDGVVAGVDLALHVPKPKGLRNDDRDVLPVDVEPRIVLARPPRVVDRLNELGGQARLEEHNGGFLIRGYGCPLSAATQRHPVACNAVESLFAEFAGIPVAKCCDAEDRLRCCFEVGGGEGRAQGR
jgi:hypothetical protein